MNRFGEILIYCFNYSLSENTQILVNMYVAQLQPAWHDEKLINYRIF